MNQQLPTPPPPELRLDFYGTAVIMTQWKRDGRAQTYPVSIYDVASACAHMEMKSGFLPPNTLFWRQRANQTTLGVYVPARRWQVQTAERSYHIPMPPFIFVGNGGSYKIFAVKKRPALSGDQDRMSKGPSSEHARLYRAPCPNVYPQGNICQGNTPFPSCSSQTIQTALQMFMEDSYFNADLCVGKCASYESDVRQLWGKLDGKKRFPLKELLPTQKKLRDLL